MDPRLDVMRRAAATMRQRAEVANTTGVRRPYGGDQVPPVSEAKWATLVGDYLGGSLGTHCASWTPSVASAIADWLDEVAEAQSFTDSRRDIYLDHALAVAYAYLREHGRDQKDGSTLTVDEHTPPPERVAYAEDRKDRLWTGKGWSNWRCMHASGLGPMSWDQAWRDHGPLVPLIPANQSQGGER